MCIIAYKPLNKMFPKDEFIQNCFENNPDGAGFMYSINGKVYIQKGYMTYDSFKKALDKAIETTGTNVPYVLHFRISTQGDGKEMTHPFPLSSKMRDLKKLKTSCNVGIAHNGIIQLTSDGGKDYSDTMLFIKEYLSLIIQRLSWHKDESTKRLIEKLISGSRLAILDKKGHCELLGDGWIEDDGIFYSNSSYSYKKTFFYNWKGWLNSDEYEKFYNKKTKLYDFEKTSCPGIIDWDDSYCDKCSRKHNCEFYSPSYYSQEYGYNSAYGYK